MKPIQTLVLATLALLSISCSVDTNFIGKTYKFKSKKRELSLTFENDTLCVFKNRFKCKNLDPNVGSISIWCTYKRVGSQVFLKNTSCPTGTPCSYELTYPMPAQMSPDCAFLSQDTDTLIRIGPNYPTPFEKFGIVPNIDVDTLSLFKKGLLLYKTNGRRSVGFILE
jgi:hypothetical protein